MIAISWSPEITQGFLVGVAASLAAALIIAVGGAVWVRARKRRRLAVLPEWLRRRSRDVAAARVRSIRAMVLERARELGEPDPGDG